MNPARRFSEALRELRWAQVVLELALLIAGILIALAVDGWIDDRRDERAERRYLELLQRDLDSNLEVLAETLEFEERQAAGAAMVYRALRAGEVPLRNGTPSRWHSTNLRHGARCGSHVPPTPTC